MKLVLFFFTTVLFLTLVIGHLSLVRADYVFPYPSYMPGNKIYRISRVVDQLKKFWYWGNIAQTKYHLALSDKYLIEAKTLFEYKQYLLAVDALERSNQVLKETPLFISRAWGEEKDIGYLVDHVKYALDAHEEILADLIINLPISYLWTPEKTVPTPLHLHDIITKSIDIRRNTSEQISNIN